MNIVFIGTDTSIITDPEGQSLNRQLRYAKHFDKLVMIILCLKSPNLRVVKLKNLTVIPTNSRSRWFYLFDALNVIRKNMPVNLISAQSPFIEGLIGVVAKMIWGIKLNIQLHIDLYRSSYFRKESLQNFVFWILSFLTLGIADSIRLGSSGLMNSPKAFRAVVPMRLELFWHQPRSKTFNQIITVARFVKQKNLPLFIEVAHYFPKINFVIVGNGPEENNLRKLAKKSNVKFVTWKTQPEYRSLFLESDLYLSTSNYEGWGMAMTEAIASGLPVVTTDTGCVGDLIISGQVGGLVSRQGDLAGLTSAVKKILEDKTFSKNLVLAAQKKLKIDYGEERLTSDFTRGLLRNYN